MGGALVILVGGALGLGALVLLVGLPISGLVVAALGLSHVGRGDFVPVTYNLRSLLVRKVSTALTALGLALVVFVFATVLMLGRGIEQTLAASGSRDNVKVLRKGAQSEIQSGVTTELSRLVTAAPEVAVAADGAPLASPEMIVLIFALRTTPESDTDGSNIAVRGVSARALEVHPGITLAGRMFQPGTSEIVIGKALAGRFQGMALGQKVRFARREWSVVGVLDSKGSSFDSEVWGDVDQFGDAFQRRGGYSSLTVRLRDRAMLPALEARLGADPQLSQLDVVRESAYYEAQSKGLSAFIKFLGTFVAIIFAVGAALGAMITMYAQVAARTREIGTLRALGFRRRAVLVSFLVESVLLGLAAGVVGLFGASFMRYASFSTVNFQSFSEVTVRFALSGPIVAWSLAFAAVMGYAGGLLPAMRAARMPIIDATRGG